MKVFIVAGELSGDKLAAWYVRKRSGDQFWGIGGNFLEQAGVVLYERLEKLNIAGVVEILTHLRFIFKFLGEVSRHVKGFDEVVVVDFPGFNLRLIKRIKRLYPEIKITYLCPPQLWIWGAWRIKSIKRYCDQVIVLYPFEVDWYQKRGVKAVWLGHPFYDQLKPYFGVQKSNVIALLPGSRLAEIKRLLPLFLSVAKEFKRRHPEVRFVLPLAESIERGIVGNEVEVVEGDRAKLEILSSCCLAITKPGTVSLELGLLMVPAVVVYKTSWITYVIARMLVNITSMSLPSILLGERVYPECIQSECTERHILAELEKLYGDYRAKNARYQALMQKLGILRNMLS